MADLGFGKEGFQVCGRRPHRRRQSAALVALPREVWGYAPPEYFGNMNALRRVLLHSGTRRTPYVFYVLKWERLLRSIMEATPTFVIRQHPDIIL